MLGSFDINRVTLETALIELTGRDFLDLGVDGIVTDRPDVLNEVLGV